MAHLVKVNGLTKTFQDGCTRFTALSKVDLTISDGEFTAITGPSGCGKTTLLNIIGCIEKPDIGEVFFDNERVPYEKMSSLDSFRRDKVGMIFQDFNLISVLSGYENIELPILFSGFSRAERHERVMELLVAVDLESHKHHKPNALSGGQCQRVAIARAMINQPRLVLADEPTANLDAESAEHVMNLMYKVSEEYNTSFLIATHDPRIMNRLDKQIPIMEGKINENVAPGI